MDDLKHDSDAAGHQKTILQGKSVQISHSRHGSNRPTERPDASPRQHSESDRTLTNDGQSDRSKETDSARILTWLPNDPEHPNNWSSWKKFYVLFAGIITVINSTLGSSLPAGATTYILDTFGVTSDIQAPLPISCFLAGYVIGPVVCGPLSENFGRKAVMTSTFVLYIIFTMACAVAPNWPALLVFRFLCGVVASSPIAIVGGVYADIYNDPRKRGMAMAYFMAATTAGPICGPILSGFIAENVSWRWVFGVGTFFALATLPILLLMPETYAPTLLSRRAAKLRKETGENVIAKTDLNTNSWSYVMTVVMTRPYRMLFQELIVACVCAYCALAYAIFYLFFEAYPLIFQGPDSVYKWSPGLAGLAFLPIAIGAIICGFIFVWWDSYLAKARAEGRPWTKQEEYRRLPLACVGGPLYVISLFWLGWTARPDVHWIVPVLSGLPFGMGFLLIFMALLNYLSDAYETFAASALGISSTARSVFGVLLPLATHKLFGNLGINWACTLLAFLSMMMAVIPFAFIKWGDQIRANSKFCQELRALKAQEEEEAAAEGANQDSNTSRARADEKV